jgi:hypothetical protein
MKSNLLFGSILAAALSVGVGAQAPTGAPQDPTSPRPSSDQPMAKSSSDAITVTGCVQADSAAATGTSGSAAGAPSAKSESFILANATAGSGAGAAAGTAGTTGAGASASQYKLSGKSDDLKKYVNSKVEIKGKVDSASAGAASSSGPTLRVDSVKQVSPSCSQQ